MLDKRGRFALPKRVAMFWHKGSSESDIDGVKEFQGGGMRINNYSAPSQDAFASIQASRTSEEKHKDALITRSKSTYATFPPSLTPNLPSFITLLVESSIWSFLVY
jgi:hypothetical protein